MKWKRSRDTWTQDLLALLPREVVDVAAGYYESTKVALLEKYRLSTPALRQHFCGSSEKSGEFFPADLGKPRGYVGTMAVW